MDNKICVGYLTNIRDMFVVGSERCEGEALEYQNKFINALNYAIEFIDNAPTVEERPQGTWIKHISELYPNESTEECPFCHEEQTICGNDDNFCPNCGADMREEGKA